MIDQEVLSQNSVRRLLHILQLPQGLQLPIRHTLSIPIRRIHKHLLHLHSDNHPSHSKAITLTKLSRLLRRILIHRPHPVPQRPALLRLSRIIARLLAERIQPCQSMSFELVDAFDSAQRFFSWLGLLGEDDLLGFGGFEVTVGVAGRFLAPLAHGGGRRIV